MRLFNLQETVTKELNEVTWSYRLHLKDVFKSYQAQKISLKQAASIIVKRINQFLNDNDTLPEDAKTAFTDIMNSIANATEIDVIDQLIGINLYDIADEYGVLVK